MIQTAGKKDNKTIMDEIRLINADGQQLGVVSWLDAKKYAQEANLDLVEISSDAKPPVYKIMDSEKFRYEQSKRDREKKRKQRKNAIKVKEIKFSISIQEHDIKFKLLHVKEFLDKGNHVKIYIQLRGREMQYKDKAITTIKRLLEEIKLVKNIQQSTITSAGNTVACTIQAI